MDIVDTSFKGFVGLMSCFDSFPKIIPANSVLVLKEKKPVALLCVYYDSGVIFIHGLFKSRDSTKREFFEASKVLEKYVLENFVGKFSVVTFTKFKSLKRMFLKNNFKSEEITLLARGVN